MGSSSSSTHSRSRSVPARRLLRTADISGPMDPLGGGAQARKVPRDYDLSHRSEPEHAIHRYVNRYISKEMTELKRS